jgi:predicted Zn-dependent protease
MRCFVYRTLPVVMFLAALSSAGCRPSDQQVIGQANQVHGSLDPAVIKDPEVQNYMDKIGQRIIDAAIAYDKEGKESEEHKGQDNSWMYSGNVKFHLVNSKTLNAFTTGGQHIYIYNQLFQDAKSEDELAGVMSHEFAHIYARHVHSGTERQYWPLATAALGAVAGYAAGGDNRTQLATAGAGAGAAAGKLFTNSFTRTDENEADKLGLSFYSRAGWDPAKFADFFEQMIAKGYDKTPEVLSDHPSLAARVKATQERVAAQSPEAAKARRRAPIAGPQQFAAIQQRAITVAANTPSDQTLAAAQLMLSAFPSCVTPEDQPDQKSAQQRLLKAVNASRGGK